jgi:excisionase family DNA binding protein
MISDSPGRETAGAIVCSCKLSARQGDTPMLRDPAIPRLLSVTDTADLLGCSRQHVNNLIRDNKLPAAYAGNTLVVAEETALRYKAGERFHQPSQLVVSTYDQDGDRWAINRKAPVGPDYSMPLAFDVTQWGIAADQRYRVELLDTTGKVIAVVHGEQLE